MVRGASTITQQLARGLFLTRERTWWRKVREIGIALLLERRYTQAGNPRGVPQHRLSRAGSGTPPSAAWRRAARHLFGKDTHALTVDEAALLATAIRAPNRVFADDASRVRARRDRVLAPWWRRAR